MLKDDMDYGDLPRPNEDEVPKKEKPNSTNKIIRLTPSWSKIKDLVPPLTPEVKKQIREIRVLQDAFVEPQLTAVFADAQDRFLPSHPNGIGFRAIMTSTPGHVTFQVPGKKDSYDVLDMNETVQLGIEKPVETIRVSVQLSKSEEPDALDHDRVFQYLVNAVSIILRVDNPQIQKKLAPAVLVYDLEQLQNISGYECAFKDPNNKQDALLALYPIDIDPAKPSPEQ